LFDTWTMAMKMVNFSCPFILWQIWTTIYFSRSVYHFWVDVKACK
jgi:hypothetical protein